MNESEKRLFILVATVIGVYLGLRAYFVPVVHDEAATFLHYLQVDSYIPYFALWDANNHILNSALAHAFVNLFNDHVFWLRLPNLLTFPLFCFYLYRLVSPIHQPVVRWLVALAMLTASFQIEFFALARGYGMSISFLLGAVFHASLYLQKGELRHQWWLWTFMFLALLANMSLMLCLIIFLGMCGLKLLNLKNKDWKKHALTLIFFGGGLFLLASFYALKMKVLGLLYTGSTAGFVSVTSYSFARFQFDYPSMTLAWMLTIIGLISGGSLVYGWISSRFKWSSAAVVGLLLILNAVGAILLEKLLGVNYPDERTALYFLTFLILSVGYASNQAAYINRKLIWFSLPLLYFPIQLMSTANLSTSQLWAYLHIDQKIIQRAAEMQTLSERPLRISGGRMHELSWAYQNIACNCGLQLLERESFPDTTADLIIARALDVDFSSLNSDTVYYNPTTHFALLKPNNDTKSSYVTDTLSLPLHYSGNETYFNLARWNLDQDLGESGLLNFDFTANSRNNPMHYQIVITSQDSVGTTLSYEYIPLHWLSIIIDHLYSYLATS